MSATATEANVATVRAYVDEINNARPSPPDELERFLDPDVVWHGGPAGRDMVGGEVSYRGYDGIRRFFEEVGTHVETWRFDDVRIDAFGADVVAAFATLRLVARGSGMELAQEMGYVYGMRGGRICSGEAFRSHADAEAHARRLGEAADAQA